MKKPRKHKLVIVEFEGLRIAFGTTHPLPDYFSVTVKGQEVLKVDSSKGLKAIAEIWVS